MFTCFPPHWGTGSSQGRTCLGCGWRRAGEGRSWGAWTAASKLQPACLVSILEEITILIASLQRLPALAWEYTPSCCLLLPSPFLPMMEGTHWSAHEARTRIPWPGFQLCSVQMQDCWFERWGGIKIRWPTAPFQPSWFILRLLYEV